MDKALPFFDHYDDVTQRLVLRDVTHISDEIIDFAAMHSVRILDVIGGSISFLPDNFYKLADLEIVFFSNAAFKTFPPQLRLCSGLYMASFKNCGMTDIAEDILPTSLQWLILTGNRLKSLPRSVGKLSQLRKFSLAGNLLESLPDDMQNCQNLELLRLSANNFKSAPPAWLFDLPNLTWYSDAGNPFSLKGETHDIPALHWDNISVGDLIAESPSSRVFQARNTLNGQNIALKLFKGDLTSDGYPADDMQASLIAGKHPNLVEIQNRVDGEPQGKPALTMSLIPDRYKRLGLPPTFETCTRDTFSAGTVFTLDFTINVLHSIAAACAHIHQCNLMHGDIYAHNIQAESAGHALLCDFGAASLYRPGSENRELIDVRAYGCLVDDMLMHMDRHHSDTSQLTVLRDICMGPKNMRPPFATILDYFEKGRAAHTLFTAQNGG